MKRKNSPDTMPKSSPASQNEPWEFVAPRGRSYADPTPVRRLGTAICRAIGYPDCYRPGHCAQCQAKHTLTAHGFYTRTFIDTAFDGIIRVPRYLCQVCQRTVSLLPEFVLPYLRGQFWLRRFRVLEGR